MDINRAKAKAFLRNAIALVAIFTAAGPYIGFGLTVAQVVWVRFCDPPGTPTMVQRSLAHVRAGKGLAWPDREVRSLEELGDHVPRAVLAAEDARFYLHGGFDWESVCKAVRDRATGKRKRLRGASTISQQTAKNLFLWQGRSWIRKGLELYYTALLETIVPKDRILELYLNVAETGPMVFGAEAGGEAPLRPIGGGAVRGAGRAPGGHLPRSAAAQRRGEGRAGAGRVRARQPRSPARRSAVEGGRGELGGGGARAVQLPRSVTRARSGVWEYVGFVGTELPDLENISSLRKVWRGARYALGGVWLITARPSLWGYLIAPASITLLLFFGVSFFAWHGIGMAMDALWTPGVDTSLFTIGVWMTIELLVRVMAIGTTALALYFAAGLVATPFNDRLSEHVETSILGPYEEPFSWRVMAVDLAISVSHSLLSLTIWLTVMLFSFVLNLIPGAGTVASFAVGTVATAVFLSREAIDGCMSRRRMSYGHKFRVMIQHFPLFLGFGVVASCMLWVPFLNFLLLPMAVAGGTRMYCHLEQLGLVPDSDGNLGYVPSRSRVAALADGGEPYDAFGDFTHPPSRAPSHARAHDPARDLTRERDLAYDRDLADKDRARASQHAG